MIIELSLWAKIRMMFSKACEYGIKIMIFIAQEDAKPGRVGLSAIVEATKAPRAFAAKILQNLAREGLLLSAKGPSGGFELATSANNISMASIVKAIDGDEIFEGCALGLEKCDATKPCPVHFKFVKVRDELSAMMHTSNLDELSKGLKTGLRHLVR